MNIFKTFRAWLALTMGICWLGPATTVRAEHDVTFIALTSSEPLIIVERQRIRGFVTEIVHEIFRRADHRVQSKSLSPEKFHRLVESGLETDWITFGSPAWHSRESRRDLYAYSDSPLFRFRYSLVSSVPSIDVDRIDDLFGKRIILIQGYGYPELAPHLSFQKDSGKIMPYYVSSRETALNMILEGRADFFLSGTLRAHWVARQLGIPAQKIRIQGFTHFFPEQSVYLAFNPTMPEKLQRLINIHLRELSDSGFIEEHLVDYHYIEPALESARQ